MENSPKKRLLIFLHKFPYPDTDSTKFRILNSVILPLRQYFDIKIFVVTYENIKKEDLIFLKNIAPLEFYIFSKWQFFLNVLLNFFSLRPFQTEMFFFRKVFLRFQGEAKKSDVIYIHTVRLGKYIEKLSPELRKKIILDFNDSIAMHYLNGWKYYPWHLKFVILLEGIKLYFYEKKIFKILDNFTIVSEIDKNFILNNIPEKFLKDKKFKITYISTKILDNNFDNSIIENDKYNINNEYICFMGNLKYYPNKEGLIHFLKDIWPDIKKEFEDLEFLIIGKVDSRFQNKFRKSKGVRFLGFVYDHSLIIKKALAFISPVRIGAGIQGKIVEAMAMGQIVICYPLGIENVNGFKNEENIIICENFNSKQWIKTLKKIKENCELVKNIQKNSRELVLREFSEKAVANRYIKIFSDIF